MAQLAAALLQQVGGLAEEGVLAGELFVLSM